TALHVLFDEFELELARLVLELLRDPLRAMAHDDDGLVNITLRECVDDIEHHGAPAQHVQRLRPGGAHARPLTGGEDHGAQGTFRHRPSFYRCDAANIHQAG